jgi:hypothetical protein
MFCENKSICQWDNDGLITLTVYEITSLEEKFSLILDSYSTSLFMLVG